MSEQVIGTFEMLWDCSFCGQKKLLAITHRHCPNCGAEQDQTKRYFPAEGEKVAVTDDFAGADKSCPNCKAPNGAKATFCMKCGAPLDDAAAVKVRSERVAGVGQTFAADDAKKAEAELGEHAKPKVAAPVKRKRSWVWLYILLGVAGLCFLVWFMCIRKKSADFVVEAQRWKKTIPIEVWDEFPHEDWQDKLPAGARTTGCHDKQFDSKKVYDHDDCVTKQVDKGNGAMEERRVCTPVYRNDPIEKPWCSYMIFEWGKSKDHPDLVATADDGKEPDWPATGVKPATQVMGQIPRGTLREGTRSETFEVDVKDPRSGQTATCSIDKAIWQKLPKGAKAHGEERARSGDIVCDSIRPK